MYVLHLSLRRPGMQIVTILTPLVESGIITSAINNYRTLLKKIFFLNFFRNKFLIPLMGSGNFFLDFYDFFLTGFFSIFSF